MVKMQILNLDIARKDFKDMQQRTQNPSTAMEIIAIKGWRDTLDHFAKEQGPYGPWKKLADSTIAQRKKGKKKRLSARILQDTGRLRMGNRFETVGTNEAHIYNQVRYGIYHQSDEPRKSNLPQRKFMWLSDTARISINRTIIRFIATGDLNVI